MNNFDHTSSFICLCPLDLATKLNLNIYIETSLLSQLNCLTCIYFQLISSLLWNRSCSRHNIVSRAQTGSAWDECYVNLYSQRYSPAKDHVVQKWLPFVRDKQRVCNWTRE